ncbi:hypothetical protein EW146_g749 [Bondarzewia mesenterica]|uniref:Uncharacterized protein n=1 Tax=Bondarzewia mesenterica TaxID=1095465 RepID=A0A4S4M7C5_9AGAM|nr:hypothetical protein EW146_g749 [Bondarzewia mesenterica]
MDRATSSNAITTAVINDLVEAPTGQDFKTMTASEKKAELDRLSYFFKTISEPRPRNARRFPGPSSSRQPYQNLTPPVDARRRELTLPTKPEKGHNLVETPAMPITTIETNVPSTSPTGSICFPISTRPSRSTVASSDMPHAQSESESQQQREVYFPQTGECRPFTFNLMMHKLYKADEWAAKVQEVLAESRRRYRSLEIGGETSRETSPSKSVSSSAQGLVFSTALPLTGLPVRRSPSKGRFKDVVSTFPSAHAVKKRIVNRRRLNGGLDIAAVNGWTYDSTVASSETEAERTTMKSGAVEELGRKRGISFVQLGSDERGRGRPLVRNLPKKMQRVNSPRKTRVRTLLT